MSIAVEAHRPGSRSLMIMVAAEAKMVMRDTAGLIIPFALPLLIMLMSASAAGDETVANGRTVLEVFVLPLALTMVIATIGIINMPSFLAYYRRAGILRRLAVTPASAAMVLTAQVIVSAAQTVIGVAIAMAVAMFGFGAQLPVHLGTALAVFALAASAMYALGMVVAAVAPTPNSAVAIGLVAFFAVGALGGMFGGRDALPEPLARIGELLPFGASIDALGSAWVGATLPLEALISLGVTVVLGTTIAATVFRWG